MADIIAPIIGPLGDAAVGRQTAGDQRRLRSCRRRGGGSPRDRYCADSRPPPTPGVVYDPHPTLCLPTVAALYTALDSVNLSLCHVVLRQTERATATCGYWLGTLK